MSLFAKFKKKKGAAEPKQPPQPPKAIVEPTRKSPTPEIVEDEPPGHAVEIDSIFSGLVLSGKVTTNEGRNSPYLQKKETTEPESDDFEQPTSSFNFLNKGPEESGTTGEATEEEEEDGNSSFDFLKSSSTVTAEQEGEEQSGSGFSFLNQASESHDLEQPSHVESRDTTQTTQKKDETHDQMAVDTQSIDSVSTDQTSDSVRSEEKTVPPANVVAKQQPPSGGKKKTRRALRPGHAAKEEEHPGNLLVEESGRAPVSPLHEQLSTEKESRIDKASDVENTDPKTVTVSEAELPPRDSESKPTREVTYIEEEILQQTSEVDRPVDQVSDDKEPETQELVNLTAAEEESQEQNVPTDTQTNDDSQLLADVFTVESANYEVELSAQEEFVTLLESFESGLQRIRLGIEQTKGEHKSALEEQMKLTRDQIERREKVKELKEQEAKALSEEDYELAEKLSHQLEETQLFQEDKIAEICLQAIEQWMIKCCEVAESEITFRKDMHNQLTSLKSDHAKALSEMEKELSLLQSKDKMRLKAMEDKIERERGHIALDREHLEKSEQGLSEELNSRAAGFISSKEQLKEQLQSIETEISELEAKLAALRTQRSDIQQNILEEEEKIQSVEKELAEEHSELYAERQQIEQREAKLTKEVDKYTLECNAVEAVHNEQERKRRSLVQVVEKVDLQCGDHEGIELSLSQCNKVMDTLMPLLEKGRTILKPSPQLHSVLEQCANKSKEVEEITTQLLASQAELSSLRKKVVEWETQLPQLQDAKKAAVAARQFKEASRLAGETKEVSSSLEREKVNVSKMEEKLSTSNKQLSLLSEELAALKDQVNSLEKEEDEKHIQHLLESSNEISSQCVSVENTALHEAVEQWCQLNQLLCVSLSVKHGLEFSVPQREGTKVDTSEQSDTVDKIPEERTPGVGMEDNSERLERQNELKMKLAQIGADVEKACEEEDYDRAAELDEEMKAVQKLLDEL